MSGRCVAALLVACLASMPATGQDSPPDDSAAFRRAFIESNCIPCHGPEQQKGNFRIDTASYELTEAAARERWELVRRFVEEEDMPPLEALRFPTREERDRFVADIAADTATADARAPVGGTLLRRLNRAELLNTLRDLFGIRGIRLPSSFPEDMTELPFDTMPEGISFSTAHLNACMVLATDIAERMLFLPAPLQTSSTSSHAAWSRERGAWTRPADADACFFTGINIAAWSGGIWDRAFVAPVSGTYDVSVRVNAEAGAGADGRPLRLVFHALVQGDYELPERANRIDLPRVGSLEVANLEPQLLSCEVELEQGESFQVYCENRLAQFYPDRGPNRGEIGTLVMQAKQMQQPTIRIESMTINGPVAPLSRQVAFLGGQAAARDEQFVRAVLLPLAQRAWRRPLTDTEQRDLIGSVMRHMAGAPAPEFGIHYGIRRILCSPPFLYLDAQAGALDDHALASRLSYFLWSSMPDAELIGLADAGRISDPDVLAAQVRRMLGDAKGQRLVQNFTGQWLANREVATIMVCDIRNVWSELIRHGFIRSTELFFDEILSQNLSVRTFIDSTFTYCNLPMRIAWKFPGEHPSFDTLEDDQVQSLVWPEPERLDLTSLADGVPAEVARRGGILGLPGVLAATGDGVESSPILRGVWVLDNMFGTPPPPPPSDVPALVADTSGARTIRETLAAHQASESCAKCHAKIDPVGFALENYDAVGNWRTEYFRETPATGKPLPCNPVDTTGVLPDGVRLSSPDDIKHYLLAHADLFTTCLTTKLLEYATGRQLSVGDERVLRQLVQAEPAEGYGFRDLIVAVVQSEAFRTK